MIYSPDWLDLLQAAPQLEWDAVVFRHMFGDIPPIRRNTGGARWNPRGREAIYTSCERETALAEAEHQISLQTFPPKAKRTLYAIKVSLSSVVDLRDPESLETLGITPVELAGLDMSACQRVGEAVAWLKYAGLLVPSARRASGSNLVIYQQDLTTSAFEIVGSEIISADSR